MTRGGAGVARELRRSTAYGLRTDQRSDVATTCTVTTTAAQTIETSCDTVGTPGPQRREQQRDGDRGEQDLHQHGDPGDEGEPR